MCPDRTPTACRPAFRYRDVTAGFAPADYHVLAQSPERLEGIDCRYLLSHLACAEQAEHPMNVCQREEFEQVIRAFPDLTHSLAASSGVFLGSKWHFGMVRCGLALYGGNPNLKAANPMRQVVTLKGKILQIREIDAPRPLAMCALYRVGQNADRNGRRRICRRLSQAIE